MKLNYTYKAVFHFIFFAIGLSTAYSTASVFDNRQIDLNSYMEEIELEKALSQSYLFLENEDDTISAISQDACYLIRFYLPHIFLLEKSMDYDSLFVDDLKTTSTEKKIKRNQSLTSWKLAYESLKEETGLLYLHLFKRQNTPKKLVIFDKLGLSHCIALDKNPFYIQRKAQTLSKVLLDLKQSCNHAEAQQVILKVLKLIEKEYQKNLRDNNNDLISSSGIIESGQPIKLNIDRFESTDIKAPILYYNYLFNKTYDLKLWLEREYPLLSAFLETELIAIMGSLYKVNGDLKKSMQIGDAMSLNQHFRQLFEIIKENKELTRISEDYWRCL